MLFGAEGAEKVGESGSQVGGEGGVLGPARGEILCVHRGERPDVNDTNRRQLPPETKHS